MSLNESDNAAAIYFIKKNFSNWGNNIEQNEIKTKKFSAAHIQMANFHCKACHGSQSCRRCTSWPRVRRSSRSRRPCCRCSCPAEACPMPQCWTNDHLDLRQSWCPSRPRPSRWSEGVGTWDLHSRRNRKPGRWSRLHKRRLKINWEQSVKSKGTKKQWNANKEGFGNRLERQPYRGTAANFHPVPVQAASCSKQIKSQHDQRQIGQEFVLLLRVKKQDV